MGICVERSLEMVVGILGILKAGGAYVPLDPSYPEARLSYMLADTGTSLLLTQQRLVDDLPEFGGQVLCLDRDWKEIAEAPSHDPAGGAMANTLAYVIYTSGSTGRPKGTCVEHRAVVRLVKNTNYVELGPDEVVLQFAPISFDASTFEIWGSLLNGGRLVVFPPKTPAIHELGAFIRDHEISTLWLTAALFAQMIDLEPESLRGVRQLLAGGEALSVPHVVRALEMLGDRTLINGYGPTENTTFTCCYRMTRNTRIGRTVPIGIPIANTQVYILDDRMKPVPPGMTGELYIGGDGLARGYLNRPELTEDRFVPSPFSDDPAAHLYATGDQARYLTDGNIEFLGRLDHQVKIRGFRIELGEIETVLAERPEVSQVVAQVREDVPGDRRLVAYIVAEAGSDFTLSDLRRHVKERLPDYMVPSAIVMLESLPLTPNGKVDRRALPVPELSREDLEEDYVAPRTALEEQLVEMWSELIGSDRIGVHDNFFALGGHSLLATQIVSRIRDAFSVVLPVDDLFNSPTIAGIAERLEQLRVMQGLIPPNDDSDEEDVEQIII